MSELFRKNKIFRLLLMYQFFSGLGGGVFSVFMLLSVHLIYQNPIYTGIAGFLMTLPFIFAFAVGPVVDRGNKVSIMRLTTLLEFAVLALLAFAPLQERFGVVFMFAVIFIYSLAALFEAPSGRALLPQVVQADEIMEANALIRIVTLVGGISIAAILFATLGEGSPYSFIYGLSAGFLALAFLFALFLKDPVAEQKSSPAQNYISDLKDGAKFIKHSVLLYITIAVLAKGFVIEVAAINLPMFAEYYVGARGYMVFRVMAMLGGVVASYFVGMFGKRFRVGQLLLVLFVLTGIMRLAFVHILPTDYRGGLIALVLYAALGSASGIVFQTLEQKIPPKDMVGRVGTISTTFASIFITIGALMGGFLGSVVPVVDHVFIYQGVSYVVIGLFIFLTPGIRKLPKVNEI